LFKVSILTINKILYQANAYSITLPGGDGELTALPGHTSLITPLKSGKIIVRTKPGDEFPKGKTDEFEIKSGVSEIRNGRELIVLAEI